MSNKQSTIALGMLLALAVTACGDDAKRPDTGDGGPSRLPDGGIAEGGMDGGPSPSGDAGPQPTACDPSTAPEVPALALAEVASVDNLVFAAQPKGSSDWYLVRQTGQIRIFRDGELLSTPFLDLTSQFGQMNEGDERGLLGLAFPPDYATSGKFYVALTPSTGPEENEDFVLEFQRSAANPLVADVASRKVLLSLPGSQANHNGGHLAFGPDGMLYVGTGDGGGACNDITELRGAPQQTSSLFGKILRLDPKAAPPYAASGNPFASGGDARVLHYGLRNPYRFNFDFVTGGLYIGDVGQDSNEELDYAPMGARGLNFGWPAFEGARAGTCPGELAAGSTHTPPVIDIDRKQGATGPFRDYISIIAGQVYRGSAIPQLRGAFVFGDWKGDRTGWVKQCGAQTSPVTPVLKRRDANSRDRSYALPSGVSFNELTAVVEDGAGELYFVANRKDLLKLVPGT